MICAVAELLAFYYNVWVHKLVATRTVRIEQQYIRFECKLDFSDIILSSILQVMNPASLLNVNVKVYSPAEAFDTLFT